MLEAAILFFAILAGLLVYRYDLYNREPWYMLLLAAALGAVTMRLVEGVELLALASVERAVSLAAVAAIVEEIARILAVGAIAVVFPKWFDDPMDGIVYGSTVGLGMAIDESFALVGHLRDPDLTVLAVEIVRLLGHLVMGGIAGFGVGVARVRVAGWPRALVRSFALAVALHFLWDWVALSGAPLSPLLTAAAVAIMASGMVVFGVLVELGARLSRQAFDPQSRRTLWGWPFRSR